MSGSRTLFRSILERGKYTFSMSLTEKGVFFLLFVTLARTTDTAGYGAIVASFAFANILAAFFEFGFGAYIQREFSAKVEGMERHLGTVVIVRAAMYLPYLGVTFLYHHLFGLPFFIETFLIITLIYLSGFASLFSKVLYGADRFRDSFTALMQSRTLVPAGVGVILLLSLPPSVLLMFLLASIAVQCVLLYRAIGATGTKIRWAFDLPVLRTILHSALPMGTGVAFVWIYDKLDVLLIRHVVGLDQVAHYSVAYSLYKAPQMFAGMLLTPLYSELSSRYAKEGSFLLRDLTMTAGMLLAGSAGAILFFVAAPDVLLVRIFGETYRSSAGLLTMLSFALPALFLNNMTGVMLNAVRHERDAMASAFIALVVNISMNIVLLPRIGITGAVLSTLCAEYCILGVQCVMLVRTGSLHWKRS